MKKTCQIRLADIENHKAYIQFLMFPLGICAIFFLLTEAL